MSHETSIQLEFPGQLDTVTCCKHKYHSLQPSSLGQSSHSCMYVGNELKYYKRY